MSDLYDADVLEWSEHQARLLQQHAAGKAARTVGSVRAARDAPWPDVPEATRNIMRANKGKDTKPEFAVRRLLHAMGYRFRLHRRDLPGSPDVVLPKRRKAIMVHGCFWHGHEGCRSGHVPATRLEYWGPKLAANRARDARKIAALREAGWSVAVVWECGTAQREDLAGWLRRFVETPDAGNSGQEGAVVGSLWEFGAAKGGGGGT